MVHHLTYDVDASMLTRSARGLVVEASDIGLRPGHWPDRIIVGDDTYYMASGTDDATLYETFAGEKHLTILND